MAPVRPGLANRGNTCFLNSALQCLSHVPELSNRLLKEEYTGQCALTREYSKLINALWGKNRPTVIDPESFQKAFCEKFPRFSENMPHDVQEVVLELVDTFEHSLGVGYIQNIFNGTETQEVVYPGGVSKKDSDITLVVVHPEKQHQTLDELLKRREAYHAFSGYIDDSGKEHHAAVTRTYITKYPSTMIISFDQYERKSAVRVPKLFENYSLFGLVVHHGSIHGGHYTAFVKHRGVWRHTDDETVVKVEPPEVGEYYLAFYKKISPK